MTTFDQIARIAAGPLTRNAMMRQFGKVVLTAFIARLITKEAHAQACASSSCNSTNCPSPSSCEGNICIPSNTSGCFNCAGGEVPCAPGECCVAGQCVSTAGCGPVCPGCAPSGSPCQMSHPEYCCTSACIAGLCV